MTSRDASGDDITHYVGDSCPGGHREESRDEDREYLGCGDGQCVVEKPRGMGTNGGCECFAWNGRFSLEHVQRLQKAFARERTLHAPVIEAARAVVDGFIDEEEFERVPGGGLRKRCMECGNVIDTDLGCDMVCGIGILRRALADLDKGAGNGG